MPQSTPRGSAYGTESKELSGFDAICAILSLEQIRSEPENMDNLIESSRKTVGLFEIDAKTDCRRYCRIKKKKISKCT